MPNFCHLVKSAPCPCHLTPPKRGFLGTRESCCTLRQRLQCSALHCTALQRYAVRCKKLKFSAVYTACCGKSFLRNFSDVILQWRDAIGRDVDCVYTALAMHCVVNTNTVLYCSDHDHCTAVQSTSLLYCSAHDITA